MNENVFGLKPYQILLVLVLVGTLIRFYNLEATGLWMDEIHSVVGTDPEKSWSEVFEYCKADQPPVFFVLLHAWFKIWPFDDFSGRILALITGIFGIPVMYFLGKEFKNSRVGLLASFLTMINYFHVDFSRQIRFYPLVFLFSAASYLFFIRIVKRNGRTLDLLLYSLSTAVLLNTHYYGMVVFVSQFILFVVVLVWKKIRDIKFIVSSLLAGTVAGLSFIYWIPVLLSDLQITQFHLEQVKWFFPVQYFWVYFRDIITCFICGVLGLVAIREMYFRLKLNSILVEDVIITGWIGLGVGIPLAYSLIRMPMMEVRYTFIILPAIILMVAIGWESLKSYRKFVLPILLSSFLINIFFLKSLYYVKHPQQKWREVTQRILKTDGPNQLVFTQYAWYYDYYFKIMKAAHAPVAPAYVDVRSLITHANSIWVITSTQFPDNGLSELQQHAIDVDFELAGGFEDTGAIVTHYVRKSNKQ